jgi:hypothetical protein
VRRNAAVINNPSRHRHARRLDSSTAPDQTHRAREIADAISGGVSLAIGFAVDAVDRRLVLHATAAVCCAKAGEATAPTHTTAKNHRRIEVAPFLRVAAEGAILCSTCRRCQADTHLVARRMWPIESIEPLGVVGYFEISRPPAVPKRTLGFKSLRSTERVDESAAA